MSRPLASTPPATPGGKPVATSAPIRGRSLVFVRVAWTVVATLTLLVFVVEIQAEFARWQIPCSIARCLDGQLPSEGVHALRDFGFSLRSYAAYGVALNILFAVVYIPVAVLIFWRKPDDRMALFASLTLLTFGLITFTGSIDAVTAEHPALRLPVSLLDFSGSACFGLFLYLFPDGRFVPWWTRWVALVWLAWQLPGYWFPGWDSDFREWPAWLNIAVWSGALSTMVYSQVHRYRHVSTPVQRQQTKWVVFGIAAALTGFLGTTLVATPLAPEPTTPRALAILLVGSALIYLFMLLIPVSIGIAVLRHHLFDVDLVINRTLVYGGLTASVIGLYMLVVGGFAEILQMRGNLIVSLLATGLVAVLFQPLRYRLQRGVNHLMYGDRDDPYAVLSRLGSRLESTLAPAAVLPAVARTVKEALKLTCVEIQIRRDGGFETATCEGDPVQEPLRLPLVYGGETVGRLILGPRAGEEGFSSEDQRLLEDLAHQIGASAHAALMTDEALRLSDDLQRSRERLVEAREEERRRLRRDLHDGLGPQLSSQALTIDAVRALMRRDPDAAEELLLELKADAQDAVTDIRRLVYGLRPPALDDLGLLGALQETAAQYSVKGLSVSVETPEGGSLPPLSAAVEVAAFRIAQEALTNVSRHAGADTCVVSLALEDTGVLCLEVRDDGVGMPDQLANPSGHAGVGLTSMRERASELGGSLVVEPLPEGGTRVQAKLPLPKEE